MSKYVNRATVGLLLGLIAFLCPWVLGVLTNSLDGFFLGLIFAIVLGIIAIFLGIGIAWRKGKNKIEKSAIIFGILMILYGSFGIIYSSYLPMGPPPPAHPTPSVPMFATANDTNCTIIMGTPTAANIKWNDAWYHLVNISSGKTHIDSIVTIPRNGTIVDGDIIYIAGGLHNNSEYRLSLVYNMTGGMMRSVGWTQ